jgi:Flp pilus assembly protein TadD
MDTFVVCPACGTRIKAGREFCLRCFGPLPTPDQPLKPPIWESIGLSDNKKQIVAGVVAALVVALGVVIYITEPPDVDDTPRPGAMAVTPRPAAPAVQPASSTPATSVQPAAAPTSDATEGAAIFTPTQPKPSAPLSEADIATLETRRTSYESQLAKTPDDTSLLNDLGLVLDQLGRSADAIPRFERAIQLAPDQPNYHFNLAHAAIAAGLWDQAVTQYREAARLRPQDYVPQFALALTLHRKGDDVAAIPEFQKTLKLSPNDASAHLSLGVSLETVGRVDDAIKEYRRYLAIQPGSPDAERLRSHLQGLEAAKP